MKRRPEKFRKRKISHILDTAPTHANNYDDQNGFAPQNLDRRNTSVVGQNVYKTLRTCCACKFGKVYVQIALSYACSGEI